MANLGGAGEEREDHDLGASDVGLELFDQLCQPKDLSCHSGHGGCGGGSGLVFRYQVVGVGLGGVLCRLEEQADRGGRPENWVVTGGFLLTWNSVGFNEGSGGVED